MVLEARGVVPWSSVGAKMAPRSNLYSASLPEIPSVVTFTTKNAKLTPKPLFGLALIFSALLEAVETAISGQCNIWLKTLPRSMSP